MKINELRIGNYVHENLEVISIIRNAKKGSSRKEDYFFSVYIENNSSFKHLKVSAIKPIKLTKEILENLGFKFELIEGEEPYYTKNNGSIGISIHAESFDTFIVQHKDEININPIRYLHKLQNLYFALTGQELNYNF